MSGFFINDVEACNFRGLEGKAAIDFRAGPGKGKLSLVLKEDGCETSFFDAIRWCFYGESLYEDDLNIVNRESLGEEFYVKIDFIRDGKPYELRRSCERPYLKEKVTLLKNGEKVKQASKELERIMPPNYETAFMLEDYALTQFFNVDIADGKIPAINTLAEGKMDEYLDKATEIFDSITHRSVTVSTDFFGIALHGKTGARTEVHKLPQDERTVLALSLVLALREGAGLDAPVVIDDIIVSDAATFRRISRFLEGLDGQTIIFRSKPFKGEKCIEPTAAD